MSSPSIRAPALLDRDLQPRLRGRPAFRRRGVKAGDHSQTLAHAAAIPRRVAADLPPGAARVHRQHVERHRRRPPGERGLRRRHGACSIRAALDVANATDQTVTIDIPGGYFQLRIGDLVVTDPAGVQILGAGAPTTSIVAEGGDEVLEVDTGAAASLGGFGAVANVTLSGGEGVSVNSSNGTLVMSGAGITGSSAPPRVAPSTTVGSSGPRTAASPTTR